jgi:hypothetical protein
MIFVQPRKDETLESYLDRAPEGIREELKIWADEPGGLEDYFLVETLEDLEAIGEEGRSLLKEPDAFDQCRWLETATHVLVSDEIVMTYFIPRELVTNNVRESIRLTAELWGDNPAEDPAYNPNYDRDKETK